MGIHTFDVWSINIIFHSKLITNSNTARRTRDAQSFCFPFFFLDLNRNCSDRVVVLEASVETYKCKLENLGDLKRQMKLLEENNMTYMQNTVSLEEELRKANAARAQLETYKRQVSGLHTEHRNIYLRSLQL